MGNAVSELWVDFQVFIGRRVRCDACLDAIPVDTTTTPTFRIVKAGQQTRLVCAACYDGFYQTYITGVNVEF